jgi:DNA mismatch repair protein MutL
LYEHPLESTAPAANVGGSGLSNQVNLPVSGVPLLRLVGQIASTYLVAEGPDGLYLIDQHAAHERVLFESYLAMWQQSSQSPESTSRIPAQVLLQPLSIDLPASSARLVEEQLPLLNRLGFQVEPFGRASFLVRAIPNLLSGMDPSAALAVIVEDFEEDETPLLTENEARIIARVCKRAAVKAGQLLSVEEQRALLNDLEACQSPRTCPHGRPTMIHLSVDLLERQFGRRGAR